MAVPWAWPRDAGETVRMLQLSEKIQQRQAKNIGGYTVTSNGTSPNQPTNQPDHVLKQERKKERGRVQRTFDIPIDKGDYADLLDKEEDLLKLEARVGWSKADLCRAAWAEYVMRHHPGNNALSLHPWMDGEPFSQAAREKLGLTNTFNVKCAFCGNYFDTTKDMAVPTCPKCTKPEAFAV